MLDGRCHVMSAVAIATAFGGSRLQQRESTLKAQIRALQIEVDESKKDKQVQEIVETEYFQKLRDEAQKLRKRGQR